MRTEAAPAAGSRLGPRPEDGDPFREVAELLVDQSGTVEAALVRGIADLLQQRG